MGGFEGGRRSAPGGSAGHSAAGLGWDDGWQAAWDAHLADGPGGGSATGRGSGLLPARVVAEHRGVHMVAVRSVGSAGSVGPTGSSADGEPSGGVDGEVVLAARLSGRLRRDSTAPGGLPVVGDWVAVVARPEDGTATIRSVLPRRTQLRRRAPADHAAPIQVLAANVDVIFVATSLNRDLNVRRIERYLTTAWESGAQPVIVLTKVDLAADPVEVAAAEAELREVALNVPILVTSALTGEGLAPVRALLGPGVTVVLVGSSGVGKSTLANALLGEARLATSGIREDDSRGHHTTSSRQLIRLPGGGLLIDTPGVRELGLWDDGPGLATTFADVEALALNCRFTDCGHETEPGCAVLAAEAEGSLAPERLEDWRRLEREERHRAIEKDAIARRADKRRWVTVTRAGTQQAKAKRGELGQ